MYTQVASSRLIGEAVITPSCTAGLHACPKPGCDSALQLHRLYFRAASAPPQGYSCQQCRPSPRRPALTFTVSGMQRPCHAMGLSGNCWPSARHTCPPLPKDSTNAYELVLCRQLSTLAREACSAVPDKLERKARILTCYQRNFTAL